MQRLLAESDYWFLGNLNYVDALLNIEIVEGIISPSNVDVKIDDLGKSDKVCHFFILFAFLLLF